MRRPRSTSRWAEAPCRRATRNIKGELEAKLAGAIAAGSAAGLASVVFFAVLREGWETSLFLFAISESSNPVTTSIGAVIGLVISISLGVALYMGSRRLNLRQFFTVTGIPSSRCSSGSATSRRR